MADDEPSVLDPALNLGADDPLRAWADQNIDWRTGRLLTQDPQKAIESMINRGIAPPPVHAPSASDALPFAGDGAESPPIVRTNRDGTIAGNITSPIEPNPNAVYKPSVPLQDAKFPTPSPALTAEGDNPLDPSEVSLPRSRPAEAGPGASDMSAQSKTEKAGSALSDFSKSLSGVKALAPPPVNPVGTPSVRSPSAVSAPNLANLIALSQGVAPQTVLQRLGQLLVQGKAG